MGTFRVQIEIGDVVPVPGLLMELAV